jgi:hypothetical protein
MRPRDIPKAMPAFNNLPNLLESFRRAIANTPEYNSLLLVIYYCPNPKFILFATHKSLS